MISFTVFFFHKKNSSANFCNDRLVYFIIASIFEIKYPAPDLFIFE